jgi:hypothetical protein
MSEIEKHDGLSCEAAEEDRYGLGYGYAEFRERCLELESQLTATQERIAELEQQKYHWKSEWEDVHPRMLEAQQELASRDATIARLRTLWHEEHLRLLRWGKHDHGCEKPCSCGYDLAWKTYAVLAEPQPSPSGDAEHDREWYMQGYHRMARRVAEARQWCVDALWSEARDTTKHQRTRNEYARAAHLLTGILAEQPSPSGEAERFPDWPTVVAEGDAFEAAERDAADRES